MSALKISKRLALSATLLLFCLGTARASEDDHDHESAWEHESVYDIHEAPEETYSLNLAKASDATIKFCFAITDEASAHGVHEVEDSCHVDEENPVAVAANDPPVTVVSGTTYIATFDQDSWLSVFNLQFDEHGHYALFLEHHPSEFEVEGGTEMGAFLKDAEAHDVEPAWVAAAATSDRKTPWGNTLLGCLAVWAVTLCGVLLIINVTFWEAIKPYMMMFASGTLLSTAFALVLYESTHLLAVSGDEGLDAGRWTAMIMCGFVTSPVIGLCLRQVLPGNAEKSVSVTVADPKAADPAKLVGGCCDTDIERAGSDDAPSCEKSIENPDVRYRFLLALILGDFFHNFTDGVFIGAAFMCNTSLAWKIVGVTVAHEIPQELGDFAVLRSALGFSTPKALAYNVVSGSSVMLGGIAIMAADISNLDTGMLLAYGAGNYIYCATVHMFSQGSKTIDVEIKKLLVFIIGAVAIGLILLDHEHCVADGADAAADPHAGHAH
jgi:UTP--glucose-1-phosphate uridylyltransferase